MPRLFLAALLALVSASAFAADAPKRTHSITIDDYFSLATPFELALSPDLNRVAYTEGRWKKSANNRQANLWVVDADTGRSRRLTADRPGASALHWAPDGKAVYYLGRRSRAGEKAPPYDGKPQVWKTTLSDARSTAVTRVPGGIDGFAMDAAASSLVYLTSSNAKPAGHFAKLMGQFPNVEYDDGVTRVSQVWRLNLATWRSEKLLDQNRFVRELAITPEGTHLAMVTAPDDTIVSSEGDSHVEVYNLATRKSSVLPIGPYRTNAASPHAWLEHLAWGPGPKNRLAFNAVFDGHPTEVILGEEGPSGWTSRKMPRPSAVHLGGYGSPLAWATRDRLVFAGEQKGRARLWHYDADKPGPAALAPVNQPTDDIAIRALAAADRGDKGSRYAVIAGTPTQFPEVFLLEAGKKPRALTDLNPQTATWKLPHLSVVSWKGANGDTVEGILELPPDAKPDTPLPLVVGLHGGPTAASLFQMTYEIWEGRTYLPAHGYALLLVNYRGSTGYGDRFLTQLLGKENDIEVQDILKGVDAMVERKIADPNRLGVVGWSNGGYLTNCLISTTTRFKAASSGAGIIDTVMQWGTNDEPAYMAVLKGGLPWDRPDVYRRTSPTYRLNTIRTPTVIHVGGADPRCPPSQSRMLFRALKVYNKVPTHLLSYPGEPHGLMKYDNRKAKMTWDVAWFDRHIMGKK